MPRTQTPPANAADRFAPLTDDDIRRQTDEGSFARGRSYFRNGHIREPILRGTTIEAQCLGSESVPYRVTATLAPAGSKGGNPKAVSCTCPRGGFCKHIVALLLTWVDDPSKVRELPPLSEQLADRSPEQLIALIDKMVRRYPDLQSLIELPAAPVPGKHAGDAANALIVDVSPLQRQIRSSLARYDHYGRDYGWDNWGEWDPSEVPPEIAPIVDLMQRYADAGQWANAQAVATALAEEALDVLTGGEDVSGELGAVVLAADATLASALDAQVTLQEDQRLSPEQRRELVETIYAIWRADTFEVGGYDLSQSGVDALIRSTTSDERGLLENWLRAERGSPWERQAVIELIADLREAGGGLDNDDLVSLYRDAELWGDVARIQTEIGRVDEAIATARKHLRVPHELTRFADALMRKDEDHAGRAIALIDDLLWEVEGEDARQDEHLLEWLERQYATHGREQEALKLVRRRFERSPNLSTYNEVERIARLPALPEGTWDNVRPELLLTLKSRNDWIAVIEIHLAAGEGIAALDALDTMARKREASTRLSPAWGTGWYAGDLDLRVASAIEREAPDRSIAIYRHAADRAIAAKNRQSYRQAAGHLARVKAILEREGRGDEWAALIAALRERHKRLRALQEELEHQNLR